MQKMGTPPHSPFAIFLAKLAACPSFMIAGLLVSVIMGGWIAGLFATQFGYIVALIVIGVASFVASHFAYRQLEIHIFTLLGLALPALYAQKLSLWLFSVPGVIFGFMAFLAFAQIMDRPNQQAAALEYKRRHGNKPDKAA